MWSNIIFHKTVKSGYILGVGSWLDMKWFINILHECASIQTFWHQIGSEWGHPYEHSYANGCCINVCGQISCLLRLKNGDIMGQLPGWIWLIYNIHEYTSVCMFRDWMGGDADTCAFGHIHATCILIDFQILLTAHMECPNSSFSFIMTNKYHHHFEEW